MDAADSARLEVLAQRPRRPGNTAAPALPAFYGLAQVSAHEASTDWTLNIALHHT